jgi:hypothetical protein
MEAWHGRMPPDVRAAIPADFRDGTDDYGALSERIASAKVEDAHRIVASEADLFRRMGRARRLRFLAWAAKRSTPDRPSAWARLFEKDSESEGGEGTATGVDDIVDLFIDDIRCLKDPLAALVVVRIGDGENVRIVARAAQDVIEAPAPGGAP